MRTILINAFYSMAALVVLSAIGYWVDDSWNWRIIVYISPTNVQNIQIAIIVLCPWTLALYCFWRASNTKPDA